MAYGPALESREMADKWLEEHNKKFDLYIDGKWQTPLSKKYFKTVNPATEEVIAELASANSKDVDKAVKAAKKALPAWVKLGYHGRARYLYAIARLLQKNARLFAVLESLDNGKPIRESRDVDIPLVIRHFYHHAGWAQLMKSEMDGYQELGVVGQIIPWNFPLLMMAWKIAPAIAMGNTVVLKPASVTSLTAIAFAEICEKAGIPAGVVNILSGDRKMGGAIIDHPGISKIAFTGSTEVGQIIRKATAGSGKKLSLELGGKSPIIVLEDADQDSAVEGVVNAIWFNQGQVCCAGSRLLVQESIAKEFMAKLKKRMKTLRVGNPLDKTIDVGAIVSKGQLKTVNELVAQGEKEGYEKCQFSPLPKGKGLYFAPTLFPKMDPAATLAQTEIFGPVLVAMTFRTPKEAIQLANNTRYGLAASIWTENISTALTIAPEVKAGTVWINCHNSFDAAAGFGGYRESGYGREGGKEGLFEYVKKSLPAIKKEKRSFKVAKNSKRSTLPLVDRTAKNYIGGKQARPDSGYSMDIKGADGQVITQVPHGNRKDIRNAVEAANASKKWAGMTGHGRAQVLYYIAENLTARREEFAGRLAQMLGGTLANNYEEVDKSIDRIYEYAAQADKYDGAAHSTLKKYITIAMNEPAGLMGIRCSEDAPLLGFISTVIPAIAMGNSVIVIPSEKHSLAVTDFYQILETSDLPAGVINIVTGPADELAEVLAAHDDVEEVWYFGKTAGGEKVEAASIGNMKRTWVNQEQKWDWFNDEQSKGREFLRHATRVKNVWIPYGV